MKARRAGRFAMLVMMQRFSLLHKPSTTVAIALLCCLHSQALYPAPRIASHFDFSQYRTTWLGATTAARSPLSLRRDEDSSRVQDYPLDGSPAFVTDGRPRSVVVAADNGAARACGEASLSSEWSSADVGRTLVDGRTASRELLAALSSEAVTILVATAGESSETLEALRDATKYEAVLLGTDENAFEQLEAEVCRLEALAARAAFGARKSEVRLDFGDDTFFLSLTYDELSSANAMTLAKFCEEVDMLEIRADLLQCVRQSALADDSAAASAYRAAGRSLRGELASQIGRLRCTLREAGRGDVPLLLTARSKNQCGALADRPEAVHALSAAGLRAGVEWLDVEANWPALKTHAFVDWAAEAYPATRLLGSQHVIDSDHDVGMQTAVKLLHECALGGRADAVKLVVAARDERDSIAVGSAAAQADLDDKPCVAICLGDAGRLSRVLNRAMTPVTHSLLGAGPAAPGQLDAKTLMALRRQLFLESKRFALVATSATAMRRAKALQMAHHAAFERVGLPHTMLVLDHLPEDTSSLEGFALLDDQQDCNALAVERQSDLALRAGSVDVVSKVVVPTAARSRRLDRGDNALAAAISSALKGAGYGDLPAVIYSSSQAWIDAALVALNGLASNTVQVNPPLRPDTRYAAILLHWDIEGDLTGAGLVLDARLDDSIPLGNLAKDVVLIDSKAFLLELADQQQRLWTSRRPPRNVLQTALREPTTAAAP